VKLFKSDAEKNFQRDIDAARTSCSSLTARLAVAELEVSERREDAKRLAVEGADDGVLDKAEAKLRAAQDRVATLSSALAETKQKITVLEAEQAAAADKKLRSETVAEIDKMALALTGAADDFVFAAAQLATISAPISEVAPDCSGMHAFAASARDQVPLTIPIVLEVLRYLSAEVTSGRAKATLPEPAPAALPAPQPAPTTRVFTVRDICWTDAEGKLCTQHRWLDVDLPPVTAVRAIKIGAAVKTDDPIRKKQIGFGKHTELLPEACTNLDLDAPVVSDSRVVEPTKFTVVDTGRAPFTVRTARSKL
jgi:hypothetical protein